MFRFSKTLTTLALLTAGAAALSAQPLDRSHLNMGVQGQYSHVLNGQEIYERLLESYNHGIYSATLGVSTHPDDGDWYAYALNYPSYGFGFTFADMGSLSCKNNSHLGDVLDMYGWTEFSLIRTRSFRFGPTLEFGLSYTAAIYDGYSNLANRYFGSQLFVMLSAGLQAEHAPDAQHRHQRTVRRRGFALLFRAHALRRPAGSRPGEAGVPQGPALERIRLRRHAQLPGRV